MGPRPPPLPVRKCEGCRSVLVLPGPCPTCAQKARAGASVEAQKRSWDARRVNAHRRHGTDLKRCSCGHHLEEGACSLQECKCQVNPGCAGRIV